MIFLGIDLGGTKTAVSLGDDSGCLLSSTRFSTDTSQPPSVWFKHVDRAVASILEHRAGAEMPAAVGLSCPGPMSVKKGMMLSAPNMHQWEHVSLRDHFERTYDLPVFMNNDANACALAEWLFGEQHTCSSLVYVTMSTGIGAGIVDRGHLLQGNTDVAGEAGHIVIDADGPVCSCGQRGCFEAFCGGRQLAERLGKTYDFSADTPFTFKDFTQQVRAGSPWAVNEWDQYMERLAQGFGTILMMYNPEALVLGTIGIHCRDLLFPALPERMQSYCWPAALEGCTVKPSSLGTQIGELSSIALAVKGYHS